MSVFAAASQRRVRWRAAPMFFLGLGVACLGCFTDPINRAPVVMSIEPEAPPMRAKPASFSATAYDPDSDSFTLSWAKTDTCTDVADHARASATAGQRLTVDKGDTETPFCVWAFATDRYGAVGWKNLPVDPGELPPVAMIELLSPQAATLYPLYKTFELSDASNDPQGDSVTSDWSLDRPAGSLAQLGANGCSKTGNDVHCFTADVPGLYTVRLKATAHGQSSMDTMAINVNVDTLPCIDLTSCVPKLDGTPTLDPTQAQSFKVQMVTDDGDPTPYAQFTWFFTLNGALLPFEHDYATLPIPPDQYHEGDVAKIRVEVYDRNRQPVRCDEAADLCAGDPERPTCYQRVTWTVNWL